MIPRHSLLADVDGAMNAVAVRGDAVGPTSIYGAGAGEMPTASAVVGDLMEIAREIRAAARRPGGAALLHAGGESSSNPSPGAPGELVGRCYLRFTAVDRPGVLAHITGCARRARDRHRGRQPEGRGHAGESVPVIVLTHPAPESGVRGALERDRRPERRHRAHRLVRIEEEL